MNRLSKIIEEVNELMPDDASLVYEWEIPVVISTDDDEYEDSVTVTADEGGVTIPRKEEQVQELIEAFQQHVDDKKETPS